MRNTLIFIISTLLFVSTIFLPTTFAQDYTQWHLPEGAKARLGKGSIGEIVYSPDGTLLAVASRIGIWLYDTTTYQEVALLTGGVIALCSVRMAQKSQLEVGTALFVCGMYQRVKI